MLCIIVSHPLNLRRGQALSRGALSLSLVLYGYNIVHQDGRALIMILAQRQMGIRMRIHLYYFNTKLQTNQTYNTLLNDHKLIF